MWAITRRLVALALGMMTITCIPASADPINQNTMTFTAYCTGLGEITAVAVLFPSALARGGTSAFQIVGSNTVLIWYTPGTARLADQAGTSCEVTSVNGEPTSGEVATFITGGPAGLWNPAADWKNAPDQANPSPDSYGHANVWRYLASSGFEHDPSTYQLLPNYQAAGEQWNDPAYVNLLVEHSAPTSQTLFMHPWGGRVIADGRNAIVGWTSPVSGRIKVNGSVRLADLTACPSGTGTLWSIDREAESLLQTAIEPGESAEFGFSTNIRVGETLFFIHDPGWDANCDGAVVQLQITKP